MVIKQQHLLINLSDDSDWGFDFKKKQDKIKIFMQEFSM
jgi:hypothetical protein